MFIDKKLVFLLAAMFNLILAISGSTETIYVSGDISTSTMWTSENIYNLQEQIYVLPGASLTIEAGTIVSSSAGLGGSLAVCRGAKIFIHGTSDKPVIMTSSADDLKNWHEGANEWGNLTIMGRGLISASHSGTSDTPVSITEDEDGIPGGLTTVRTNTAVPDGLNKKQMEGLTADFAGDPKVLYGGNDDNDDSGSIRYLSLRYGGKVIGLNNELNALSLGGIGRETEMDHIDIMNNVDDGIEIWGGTVNLKYVNIWNIGDDSLDVDQGWRGKAQFGLIVQGYSADASQGSGVGDNCFETDGAENSYAQPVTTSTIYNFTVIGQPAPGAGDHGTAWRDNARVQYRNCIFMDLGDRLVSFDNVDGDGADGYGANGTLSWADTWSTPYTARSTVNSGTGTGGAYNDPEVIYQVQSSGTLAEMSDSVFYNNNSAAAYTESNNRSVTLNGGSNPDNYNIVAATSPIRALTRGADVVKGGLTMRPVTFINPLPASDAVTSIAAAPSDGFFSPALYRGGFGPDFNWLEGWTAVDAYGMTDTSMNILVGDLDNDGDVDYEDLLIFSQNWHKSR